MGQPQLADGLSSGCMLFGTIFCLAATTEGKWGISPKILEFLLLLPCQWNRGHYNIYLAGLAWKLIANNPHKLWVYSTSHIEQGQRMAFISSGKVQIWSFLSVSILWLPFLPTWLYLSEVSAFRVYAFNHCTEIATKSHSERSPERVKHEERNYSASGWAGTF